MAAPLRARTVKQPKRTTKQKRDVAKKAKRRQARRKPT
jgi:hypothetical protein